MKRWFLIPVLICSCCIVNAQQPANDIQPVMDAIKELKTVYDGSSNLSFNISYTYANENTPDQILDSISALIQISNNRYHMVIGPTETIANNRYAIMLFSEDKIMYITKPASTMPDIDPMSKIDSSLLAMKGLQCSVTEKKQEKIIKIDFSGGSQYKSIQLFMDSRTGFLAKAQFIVKAETISDNQFENLKNTNTGNGYAVIEANYFGYKSTVVNDSVFNETKYFIRDDKNFRTTMEFKDYKIFIGSPNL